MFYLIDAKDIVRITPKQIEENLEENILIEIENKNIGRIIECKNGKGAIVAIKEIKEIGEGKIIYEDPGVYFDVRFTAIVSIPKIQEVVEGEVKSIKSFGAFIDLGTFDGFCHISQLFDDYVSFDEANRMFNGKETGISLKEGDKVKARIVSLSPKSTIVETKIGLTMRQPFLGKPEWMNVKKDEKKEGKEK
ncbi:MAG: DNA-directed RNA polymerase [Candidatus Altarchaeaceae archaeon]